MIAQTVSRENTPAHGPTCACGRVHGVCDGTCRNYSQSAQHIIITERDGRWNWQRHTVGLVWTSRDSYATELAAAIDAIEIARIYRAAVRLPLHLRPAVADHYRGVGYMAYTNGKPMEDCHNEFERLGWTLAALEDARLTAEAAGLFVERESPFSVENEWKVEVYA